MIRCDVHAQHDLPDMRAAFHPRLRIAELRKIEHAVDARLDASRCEERKYVRDESGNGGRALLLAAQLVGDAEQREPLCMQCLEVEVRMQHAVDVADGRQSAFESE